MYVAIYEQNIDANINIPCKSKGAKGRATNQYYDERNNFVEKYLLYWCMDDDIVIESERKNDKFNSLY